MKYTLPPSIFRLLALATQISKQEVEIKVYKRIFELAKKLTEKIGSFLPILGIKLYLELILTINRIDVNKDYDEFSY